MFCLGGLVLDGVNSCVVNNIWCFYLKLYLRGMFISRENKYKFYILRYSLSPLLSVPHWQYVSSTLRLSLFPFSHTNTHTLTHTHVHTLDIRLIIIFQFTNKLKLELRPITEGRNCTFVPEYKSAPNNNWTHSQSIDPVRSSEAKPTVNFASDVAKECGRVGGREGEG